MITGGHANCLRMAPPLTVSEDEIDLAATILDGALRTVMGRHTTAPVSAIGRSSGRPDAMTSP